MPASPIVYCSHCQNFTRPVKGIVNYRCPSCGATFTPSHIERVMRDNDAKQDLASNAGTDSREPCLVG